MNKLNDFLTRLFHSNLWTMVDPEILSKAMFPDSVRRDLRIGVKIEGFDPARTINLSNVARMTVSTSETSVLDKHAR